MAIRNLRIKGDPILEKVAKPIKEINDKIRVLAYDMIETMHAEDGVGLAANQIGMLKRICVINVGDYDRVIINPEILEMRDNKEDYEGCLSVPNYRGLVERPNYVKVKYTNLDNEEVIEEGEELLARAFCHEIDHLNGILYTQKASKVFEITDDEFDGELDDEFDDELDDKLV